MRRIHSFAVASVAVVAALGVIPTATAAPAAPARAAAYNCTSGYFCIYSGWNGSGTRCQWSQSKLANTADNCSFIQQGKKVLSVWNKTGHRVQYYTQTNYNARVGSTESGKGGNLQGSYQIRSFKPQ
ncbi:peptidase inhibitor family I36 protein [Streptomyces sp. NPDC048491]|uniref:peptidase inhibitor family I36 protein n=1 Tax=Streptomyces sp. NPDC048491 TaxID=3157207 RepID=UPI0034338742